MCKISEGHNAKRGSEPSKSMDFYIDCSRFLMFFLNALPETNFRGSKCRPMLENPIWDRFSIFQGPNSTLGPQYSTQEAPKGGVRHFARSVLEPAWAQFGAENAPRTHFHRSGVVFCSIWEGFFNNFRRIINATFQKFNTV